MANFTDSSQWLQTLVDTGADAMTNLYYVDFSGSSKLEGDDQTKFTLRVDSISGLPNPKHNSETKKFMTVDVDVPTCSFDIDKKLTLTFRLDEQLSVYNKLRELMGYTSKPSVGYATTVIGGKSQKEEKAGDYFNIRVMIPRDVPTEKSPYSNKERGNDFSTTLYTFNYCWISKISGLESFSDGAGAMTVSAEIYYYTWKGPYSTLEPWASATANN